MSIAVAVTDNAEGRAALEAAAAEAAALSVPLVVVDLTGSDDALVVPGGVEHETAVPDVPAGADEIEQVLQVLDDRPDVTRLVVGVRRRSPIGKAVLGSIAQRLILEASVPVLAVKAAG